MVHEEGAAPPQVAARGQLHPLVLLRAAVDQPELRVGGGGARAPRRRAECSQLGGRLVGLGLVLGLGLGSRTPRVELLMVISPIPPIYLPYISRTPRVELHVRRMVEVLVAHLLAIVEYSS